MTKQEQEDLLRIEKDDVLHSEFSKLPDERKTKLISLNAVRTTPYNLEFVPSNILKEDPNIITTALHANGLMLKYVPQNLITIDICIEALKESANALLYVPEELRNNYVCSIALDALENSRKVSSVLLNLISDPSQRYKGFQILVSKKPYDVFEILANIEATKIDRDLAHLAVNANGDCIALIPPELIDEKLLAAAVFESGLKVLNYESIPRKLINAEVYRNGIMDHATSFFEIPYNQRTVMQCLIGSWIYPGIFGARPEIVPESIRNGNNIYTLDQKVWENLHVNLSIESLKTLLEKGELHFDHLTTAKGRIKAIFYEQEQQKLSSQIIPTPLQISPEPEETPGKKMKL